MSYRINGIQHLGLGSDNFVNSWKWLKENFGFDIPMFDSVADAPLMQYYTNDKIVSKRAAMILNLQGGCPVELIELRSERPVRPDFEVRLGDLGIFAGKIKVDPSKLTAAREKFKSRTVSGTLGSQPQGGLSAFLQIGRAHV